MSQLETASQRGDANVVGMMIYENLLYRDTKVFRCLHCSNEEHAEDYELNDLLGSINKAFVENNLIEQYEPIDDNLAQQLIAELDDLVSDISDVEHKKIEAEKIYNRLKKAGVQVRELPWSPKSWHVSVKHTHCSLCGEYFYKRQQYVTKGCEPGTAVCRHRL